MQFAQSLSLRFIYSFLILIALFVSSCDNKDCQTSPPIFTFRLAQNGVTYPASGGSADSLKVSYGAASTLKYVTDIQVVDGSYQSMEIIWKSLEVGDPEFTVELNGKPFNVIKFKTYVNNEKCNGWPTISEVYENGKLVTRNSNGYYLFEKK